MPALPHTRTARHTEPDLVQPLLVDGRAMTRLALLAAGLALGVFARRCTDQFLDLYLHDDPPENT